jgi:YVTN family beta-propeller protein
MSVSRSATPAPYRSMALGGAAWSVAYGFGGAWIQVDPPVDQVVKVDAATSEVTLRVDGGRGVAIAEDAVWIAVGGEDVRKIDPDTGKVLMKAKVRGSYVSWGAGAVWVTVDGGIARVNPRSGAVVKIAIKAMEPTDLHATDDGVWVTDKAGAQVIRIDPRTNKVVAQIPTGGGAHDLDVLGGAVWIANYTANSVSRIDAATNQVVTTIEGVGSGVGLAACRGNVWVSRDHVGIYKVDPSTNQASLEIPSPDERNYGVACGENELWITSSSTMNGRVFRVPIA